MELNRKLDHLEMRPGEDPDHFLLRLYSFRDQLRELGEDVHPMRLTTRVINVVPRVYEPEL